MSTHTRCPRCGNTERFRVAALTTATVHEGEVEKTDKTFWDDDATTRCGNCGFVSEWSKFQAETQEERPYSRCLNCGQTIYWSSDRENWYTSPWDDEEGHGVGADCLYGDKFTSNPPGQHMPMWLTLGELRSRTAHLPDTMPITVTPAYGNENMQGEWFNLRLVDIPQNWSWERANEGHEQPSLILDVADDFDTRQW